PFTPAPNTLSHPTSSHSTTLTLQPRRSLPSPPIPAPPRAVSQPLDPLRNHLLKQLRAGSCCASPPSSAVNPPSTSTRAARSGSRPTICSLSHRVPRGFGGAGG